jgi:hypothetical protein
MDVGKVGNTLFRFPPFPYPESLTLQTVAERSEEPALSKLEPPFWFVISQRSGEIRFSTYAL